MSLMSELSLKERELLHLLQKEFPVEPEPFKVLAERLQMTEEEVLAKVKEWRASGLIRRVGAVFEPRMLGYDSALIAFSVPEERVDEVAAIVNAHPGVSHNYLREGVRAESLPNGQKPGYNMWFTLSIKGSRHALEQEYRKLAAQAGIKHSLFLPAIRTYKIKVEFELMPNARTGRWF